MRSIFLIYVFFLCTYQLFGQDTKFRNSDDIVKVNKGQLIEVSADSAYIISGQRADAINQKILELDSIKLIYNSLVSDYNQLHIEIESVRELLVNLSQQMEKDTAQIGGKFDEVLKDLNGSLDNLKVNNKELKKNNSELLEQTEKLKRINKDLRKETRHIWWNGLSDKIVAFVGGVGVGMLLILVL